MKKVLKLIGILVSVVILAALVVVIVVNVRGVPHYEPGNLEENVAITPERVQRGKKLAMMLCANCHTNSETGLLTGQQMPDAPKEFGMIYSANITQDKEFGIGSWTDGELIYLLRTGIKRDGSYAPPYMAKLPHMADEDIYSVIAFLRSDDLLVTANPTPDKPCEPSFLTKFLCNVAFGPLPMPEGKIPLPDSSNKIALGKYLAHNFECFSCHSADFKTNDFLTPEKSEGYFGGGNKPLNREGQVMLTANLTPDAETGIGSWSEEKFVKAVKYGIKDGENALQYPMTPYIYLTDYEVSAIYQYLRTIPAIQNKVPRSVYN